MGRERPALGTPFGVDGPWLAAILDVLGDLHDLIDERLPAAGKTEEGPVRITEPAPAGPAPATVPVSEPAPDDKPEPKPEPDKDDEPVEVAEPAPDLPPPPPAAGRGSSHTAWLDWARTAGVPVADDMTRDDIVAACRTAGVLNT